MVSYDRSYRLNICSAVNSEPLWGLGIREQATQDKFENMDCKIGHLQRILDFSRGRGWGGGVYRGWKGQIHRVLGKMSQDFCPTLQQLKF